MLDWFVFDLMVRVFIFIGGGGKSFISGADIVQFFEC